MWIGTRSGLYRFDGYSHYHVAPINKAKKLLPFGDLTVAHHDKQVDIFSANRRLYKSLPNDIGALDIDVDGAKLLVLSAKHINVFTLENGELAQSTTRIEETTGKLASNHDYICYSVTSGVRCQSSGLSSVKNELFNFPKPVKQMFFFQEHLIVVAGNRIYDINVKHNQISIALEHANIEVVRPTRQNYRLWVELDHQLSQLDLRSKAIVPHEFKLHQTDIHDIYDSEDGTLWVAENRLHKLIPSAVNHVKTSWASSSGQASLVEHQGITYVGDVNGLGVVNLYNGEITPLHWVNELVKGHIYRIYSDKQYLWIGGYYGTYRIDFAHREIKPVTGLSNHISHCFLPLNDTQQSNKIALCSDDGKLNIVNAETLAVERSERFTSLAVNDLAKQKSGLLAATMEGVFRFSLSTGDKEKLNTNGHEVNRILQSWEQPEHLFLGTLNHGLVRLNQTTDQLEEMVPHGVTGAVHDIYEWENHLWIATEKGLIKFDQETSTVEHKSLFEGIGQILNKDGRFYAMSSSGHLISWQHEVTDYRNYTPKLLLSNIAGDGEWFASFEDLERPEFIQLKVAVSDYLLDYYTYQFNINNNGFTPKSSQQEFIYSPRYGQNKLEVKVTDVFGDSFTKIYRFDIDRPWYASYYLLVIVAFVLARLVIDFYCTVKERRGYNARMIGLAMENVLVEAPAPRFGLFKTELDKVRVFLDMNMKELAQDSLTNLDIEMSIDAQQALTRSYGEVSLQQAIEHYITLSTTTDYNVEWHYEINVGELPKQIEARLYAIVLNLVKYVRENKDAFMAELYINGNKDNYQVRLVTDIEALSRKQKSFLPQPLWLIKQISAGLGEMSFGKDEGFSEIAINFPTKNLKSS